MNRRQLTVLLVMLGVYALSAFLMYTFFLEELAGFANLQVPASDIPPVLMGLANAGIVLVVYGLAGLGGYWFARRLGLPGIFSEDGNWRRWFWIPMGIGIAGGLMLIVGDSLFAGVNTIGHFPHPAFPASIFASLSAGIGEEIIFRGLLFGLWAFLLNLIFRRFKGRMLALWIANVIAAVAFGAGHFGLAMLLTGAESPAGLPPMLIVELILLNGLLGLAAGDRYMKDGLVAASGVHFWADVVFHVIWGAIL